MDKHGGLKVRRGGEEGDGSRLLGHETVPTREFGSDSDAVSGDRKMYVFLVLSLTHWGFIELSDTRAAIIERAGVVPGVGRDFWRNGGRNGREPSE